MNINVIVFSAVLFFFLTPGILVTLPKNGGKMTVAAVHALIFAVVFYFSNKLVGQISEGFKEGAKKGGTGTVKVHAQPKPKKGIHGSNSGNKQYY